MPLTEDFDSEGPQGTRLENVEDLRRQIAARSGAPQREAAPSAPASSVLTFRPVHRPPMALLTVLFDGREEGEIVPLRTDRTVIGRTEGDVLVPHDNMVSSRHAEITRLFDKGRWRWYLTDLDSTNGTYARVTTALLKHEQDFLLGGRRYRFDAAPQAAQTEGPSAAPAQAGGTRGWQSVNPTDVLPSFVEVKPNGTGQRYFIDQDEHWIGSDQDQASIVLAEDPMVSPRHARIYKDTKGRWVLENANSVNGVWLRIHKIPIEGAGQFQLGEQRFLLKPL
jgi:pSer/pThr/pTyr-binding forkhead associated (FHA) protein